MSKGVLGIDGGVTVYVRNSIKHRRRTDLPEGTPEFIAIEVGPIKSRPFYEAAWYRPPSDPVNSFTKFKRNLEFFDRETKKSFFLVTQIVICLRWKVFQIVPQAMLMLLYICLQFTIRLV